MKHNDSLEHRPHFVRVRQTTFKSSPLQAGETLYSLALEDIDGDTVPRAEILLGPVAGPRYQIKQRGPSGAVLFSGPKKVLPIGPRRQFESFFRSDLRKALGQPDLDD